MKAILIIITMLVWSQVSPFLITRLLSVSKDRSMMTLGNDKLNNTPHTNTAQIEADKLLEQAKKIREQLALLQKKSLEEVERDAQKEKEIMISMMQRKQQAQADDDEKETRKTVANRVIALPETAEEQTRQASLAVERAFADGITRQTVRLALIRENQLISSDEEEWPGGAQEMFREAAKPLSESLLSEIRAVSPTLLATSNITSSSRYQLPPAIKTQAIWDFDGSALITAESAVGAIGDVQALVFANTDTKYIHDIRHISKAMGKERLFLLVNPFWKNIDSWGFNMLAPGAKQLAREVIFESDDGGFEETYVLNRGTVRGEKVVALKAYPYDWQLYAYIEDESYRIPYESAIRLGSSKEKPTTALFTQLLNSRPEFRLTRTMRQLKKNF